MLRGFGETSMTSKLVVVAVVASLGLSAAGCDRIKELVKGGKTSGGQVIATVEGHEITALELRSELGGFSSADPKIMKSAQDQALQQIIVRNLLADRARKQKLDKLPQYTLQVRRGERTLLAQLYESKLFQAVTPPTRKEAEDYVANNPAKFANRRIFILDQVTAPAGQWTDDQIAALKTLEELKSMLDARSVPYQESAAAIDTLTVAQDTLQGVEKLPPGEVFIFRQGYAYVFNRVASVRNAPFRGELAIRFATDQLRKLQAQDFVRTQIIGIRRAAEANITYAKGYKPDNLDFGISTVKGAPGAPAEEPAAASGSAPAAPGAAPSAARVAPAAAAPK
jgi:EpsD family peptidyl-prolyl cis-trans isomerase